MAEQDKVTFDAQHTEHAHHEHEDHNVPMTLIPGLPGHLQTSYPIHEGHSHVGSRAHSLHGDYSNDNSAKGISREEAEIQEVDTTTPVNRNAWTRLRGRSFFRELTAEFLATMVLIIMGNGVDCQVVLSGLTKGSYLSINFGWGIGVMFGVYIAGGISGGHLNPVVTLAVGLYRGFPKYKILPYAIAQTFGAFCGACIVQGVYSGALNNFEGGAGIRTFHGATGTAALFFTAPGAPWVTNVTCFFSEFMDTAILIIMVFAIGDPRNLPPPPGMAPVVLLFIILGIGCSLGWQTGYALNPARDLGPRLALWAIGYPRDIWTANHAYWIWTPIIATTCGGVAGGAIYDLLCYQGEESPICAPWTASDRAMQVQDAEKSM